MADYPYTKSANNAFSRVMQKIPGVLASAKDIAYNTATSPAFWAPAVTAGAGVAIDKVINAVSKSNAFKQMHEVHPQMGTHDPVMVKRVFDSLYRTNPQMMRDPMVAGTWVDTIMESGGIDPRHTGQALLKGVQELAQIRNLMSQAGSREGGHIGNLLNAGTKALLADQSEAAEAKTKLENVLAGASIERRERMAREGAKALGDAASLLHAHGGDQEMKEKILNHIFSKYSV